MNAAHRVRRPTHIVVLTNAATDILALDRARPALPAGFPVCSRRWLVGLASAGERRGLHRCDHPRARLRRDLPTL
jgi:hypothetical protein